MKSNAAAAKLSIYLVLFMFAASALAPAGVESAAWVVGQQTQGILWPYIGRYTDWDVGNPRRIAVTVDFRMNNQTLGQLCGAYWRRVIYEQPWYDFNCVATEEEITANAENVGFYVGGLNANGVTFALCYVTSKYDLQLCDSDTYRFKDQKSCVPYLKCTEA